MSSETSELCFVRDKGFQGRAERQTVSSEDLLLQHGRFMSRQAAMEFLPKTLRTIGSRQAAQWSFFGNICEK